MQLIITTLPSGEMELNKRYLCFFSRFTKQVHFIEENDCIVSDRATCVRDNVLFILIIQEYPIMRDLCVQALQSVVIIIFMFAPYTGFAFSLFFASSH